ncbi:uncharacterized protein BCR38DRAFT_487963 [Pseudomassariella vexata]|uniref:Uncharacterized protein n=1 Tax=Pseudomassariella vexata TaxID=1141098 RepID=A0A1Y2DNT4_9PEZI|nr:uncharacterized protein BCR38DRAFT_487963 [Pseudomassariella vexata]ORY60910.1 hypothetical protein BCR38DRAFT_487963 [Pseudomassariella vexata]
MAKSAPRGRRTRAPPTTPYSKGVLNFPLKEAVDDGDISDASDLKCHHTEFGLQTLYPRPTQEDWNIEALVAPSPSRGLEPKPELFPAKTVENANRNKDTNLLIHEHPAPYAKHPVAVPPKGTELPVHILSWDLNSHEPADGVARRKIHLAVFSLISFFITHQRQSFSDLWQLEPFKVVAMAGGPNDCQLMWTFDQRQKMQQIANRVEYYTHRLRRVRTEMGKVSEELVQFFGRMGLDCTFGEEMGEEWKKFAEERRNESE